MALDDETWDELAEHEVREDVGADLKARWRERRGGEPVR